MTCITPLLVGTALLWQVAAANVTGSPGLAVCLRRPGGWWEHMRKSPTRQTPGRTSARSWQCPGFVNCAERCRPQSKSRRLHTRNYCYRSLAFRPSVLPQTSGWGAHRFFTRFCGCRGTKSMGPPVFWAPGLRPFRQCSVAASMAQG